MRIASISLHWPRTRDSGVGKKLARQLTLWQAGGHQARLFMHTSRYQPLSDLVPAEVFFYGPAGAAGTEFDRIAAAQRLVQAVRDYRPSVIYLRLAMYVYPVHRLAEIAPLVAETNTNDMTQHEGLGRAFALYNRLTRGFLLRRLAGLVAVSHELARAPAFGSFRKPTCVIANGIDLDNASPLPPPSNLTPRLAFIGHPGYPWHGVDKLVRLARLIPEVQLDVIGYDSVPGTGPPPDNMHLHGYLSAGEYLRIIAGADAAISSLGLHRIGLEEASPLKSRECLALGLPLVLAYIDTDLRDLDADFLLRIPNTEENTQTHADLIRDFAFRMRGRRVERRAISVIDQTAKERERVNFFEEIIAGRS